MKKKVNRRMFMRRSLELSALSAVTMSSLSDLTSVAEAQSRAQGNDNILVVVRLDGGNDVLNMLCPIEAGAEAAYRELRPNIAIPANSISQLDNEVGLASEWSALMPFWDANEMAIVHRVGYPEANQSHFESMDIWSLAQRQIGLESRSWMGRLADVHRRDNPGPNGERFRVMGIGLWDSRGLSTNGTDNSPITLGALDEFSLSNNWSAGNDNQLRNEFARAHHSMTSTVNQEGASIRNSFNSVYQALDTISQVNSSYQSSVQYPESDLGWKLEEVAKVIQGQIGTEVILTGTGGFDTHAQQDQNLPDLARGCAQALAAFRNDLIAMDMWNRTCIAVVSEFGRRNYENGSTGTDHGHGNAVLLMGGRVNGGQTFGTAPTVSDLRDNEYLPYETDFRAIIKSLIEDHLGYDPEPVVEELYTVGDNRYNLFNT